MKATTLQEGALDAGPSSPVRETVAPEKERPVGAPKFQSPSPLLTKLNQDSSGVKHFSWFFARFLDVGVQM
jgi:hypothetical protein